MKKLLLVLLTCFGLQAYSQIKAITEEGKEVILMKDGTWKYAEDQVLESVALNETRFTKPADANFQLKGDAPKYKISLNSSKWTVKKGNGDPISYTFKLKAGDAYVMLISEEIQVPLDKIVEIARSNAVDAAPDIRVIKEEERIVNGVKVRCARMEGTFAGIEAVYFGYYFSNSKGTIQLIGFTAKNLFPRYQADIEGLLNGFGGFE